ncbi:MAG: thioredoxin family protein [Pseudomonadales bacterium]
MLLDTPEAQIGWQARPFTLLDPDGRTFRLADLQAGKGLLIAFICNHCPYVQAIADRFATDANTLQSEGINVVAINSNDYRYVPADSPAMMKKFAAQHRFSFPYLIDEDQSVGRAYAAVCTPDFFGFNAGGQLQYRGRLDDARMGSSADRKAELLDAMRLIVATGRGPEKQYPSMGCSIKWREGNI